MYNLIIFSLLYLLSALHFGTVGIVPIIFANFSFIDITLSLPFGIAGIGLIILAFYTKIIDIKFKKNGIPVKLKVKKCEKIPDVIASERIIENGYDTIFEFKFKNTIIERQINTTKKFKVGSIKKGIYRETNGSNDLSVSGEGFYLAPGGEFVILAFGIVFTLVFVSSFIDISDKYIIIASFFVACISFGFIFLNSILSSLPKKKKNNNKKIYSESINDEENIEKLSQVDSNLIRYIPKNKSVINYKINIANIILFLMFAIFGITISSLSISEIRSDCEIKKNYLTTNATLKEVYNSKRFEDGNEVKIVKLIYEYKIDNVKYSLEEKIESSSVFSNFNSYKIGDIKKVYYEKNKPNVVINKTLYKFGTNMLIIGVLFVFISIYIIMREIRRVRLYKNYIIAKEKLK